MKRSSGILLPVSSLPSNYGIGTLGIEAYNFIDFLKAAGQKYWQMLPIGPVGAGDSPYSSYSTFAGCYYYIDLDMLAEEGLISADDIAGFEWGRDNESVCYELVSINKIAVLKIAFANGREKLKDEISEFRQENSAWLNNYAMYMSLKAHFEGKAWYDWPEEIKLGTEDAKHYYSELLADEIEFWIFTQFLFSKQWKALRSYAKEQGISFIGDVPIYVPLDSADVWSEPWFFQLDEEFRPIKVAGCPPDAFTAEGQLWGNPLYNWDKMKHDGYGWWIRRIAKASELYDVIRLDHFRGFSSYWAVPAEDENAINGKWMEGPGMDLIGVLTSWFFNTEFIAEDLGNLTPDVFALLKESKLPGMKVLQFAFDSKGDSLYLPHNCIENCALYIGTHDNNTTRGWLEELSDDDKKFASDYMHITEDEGWCKGMIRTGMAAPAKLFVMQMQDILELPGSCRTNMPGTPTGNWRWRMLPGADSLELAEKLRETTKLYRRFSETAEDDTAEAEDAAGGT